MAGTQGTPPKRPTSGERPTQVTANDTLLTQETTPSSSHINLTSNNQFNRYSAARRNHFSSASNQGEEDDEESKLNNRANNILSKVSSSEDESANGERPPNKLFPIQSERDELIRKVRAVLNKVSSVNYTRLRKRWLSLMPNEGGAEEDGEPRLSIHQIGEVLNLVIAKALDDTIYMHIYAGLMGYVVAKKEADISYKIRHLINAKLHHELQMLTTDKELALFHRSTQLVDATRRKKVTLHRLIAELYCEKACTSKFLYERVIDLMIVNNPVEIDENVECLCVLMTFAGQKLEEARKSWVEDIFTKLTARQNERPDTVSKRIQFMILDLIEMRSSGWSPHNKWWSPSVQRAPERERTRSSPSPQTASNEAQQAAQVSPQAQGSQQAQQQEPQHSIGKQQTARNRSRTRSEGSGLSRASASNTTESATTQADINTIPPYNLHQHEQQQQQPNRQKTNNNQSQSTSQQTRKGRELTQHQSRALMALLNKVSPLNVDSISYQLYEVLTEESLDEAVIFIVDKFLDTAFYSRTHASLIFRTSCKPNMANFGLKVGARVMKILERNPESKDTFQLLAELYNLNIVKFPQVRDALHWLTNCSSGMISAAMESLVIFLFISGAKLDSEMNDEAWMNGLIGFWEKKANQVAHNQGRPLCLLRDVIELRQNKWAPVRQPHWIPPCIDLPTIRFEPESLIRLFQSDRMEFLRFVKGETSSLSRIERFSKEALEYGVRHGNYDRDPEFLKMTGICLRVLIQHRLLRRCRLENFLGTFVNEVLLMERRVNSKAWNNWGLIMRQVF